MANYKYLLVDASSGLSLCELPMAVSSFSRVLNGVGSLTGTLPLDHPKASLSNLNGDREITVLRDEIPVWNGPITVVDATLSSREVTITAREASWYMGKRTLEINKNYNADLFYIVRDLILYMTRKQSNGATSGGTSINASLPRFFVTNGSSGTTKAVRYYGAARHLIADIVNDLVADPTTGLDYRMDYSTGSTRQSCARTLTLGSPSLGSQKTHPISEHLVTEFTRQLDRERAASRVHVVGSGYTARAQNTGSITNGDILIESVFDRSDKSNHAFLDNYARDARYRSQPPVQTFGLSFTPGSALPYGFADAGDAVHLEVGTGTMLATSGYQRVLEVGVQPSSGESAEVVTFRLAVGLDSLGT